MRYCRVTRHRELLCESSSSKYLAISHPTQSRNHVPDVDTASTAELAQGQLHEVERPAHKEKDNHVGDQEGSSSILVCSEGEPPDIAKTWKEKNCKTDIDS